jgi:hypothetical protein
LERQIWRDIIESWKKLRNPNEVDDEGLLERPGSTSDPRIRIVGERDYFSEPEPIEVEVIDWDSIRIDYDGPIPETGRREPSDEDIRETWSDFVFDTCAWYQSWKYPGHWGIHIKEACWESTATDLFRHRQYPSWKDSLKGAFLMIFLHEFFHYVTDVAATMLELSSRNSRIYLDYSAKVYSATFLKPECVEEAMANRYLYGRAETLHVNSEYLYNSLLSEPPGYRDFADYVGTRFWVGRRLLMNQINECSPLPGTDLPIEQVMELLSPWHYANGYRIPLWLHRRPGVRRIFLRG